MSRSGFVRQPLHERIKVAILEARRKAAIKRKEEITKEAYYLWEADGKPEGKSEYYWRKASIKVAPYVFLKPFYKLERQLEDVLDWLKRLAILEILGLVGNITLLIGLLAFLAGEQQRRNLEVYQAWQVITAAHEQGGSGGRKEALEFLNSSPSAPGIRRIPWFWLIWEPQSLEGLEAPKAYLVNIQLPKAKLSGANLKGTVLFKANFKEAELVGANLQYVDLSGANLQYAHFFGANLKGATLAGANLQYAGLEANLQDANLFGANLQYASLSRANLQDVDLSSAHLQGTNLSEARLQKAFLIKANLQAANLSGANLQGSDLSGANLQAANLSGANLQGTDLSGVNLQKAKLLGVKLQGAIYTNRDTKLETCESLDILGSYSIFPCPTDFPQGFNPRKVGMVLRK